MRFRPATLTRTLLTTTALAGLVLAAAHPDPAHAQAGSSWTTPLGTSQGTRFSNLNEITTSNASALVEEFNYPTGYAGGHQGGPLVVGNAMYIVTPFPNKLIALDLTHPGTTLWTYDPGANPFARGISCCDVVNRGAVYAYGLIMYAALDGTMVAVNSFTGQQVWKRQLANIENGETITSAPIVVGANVIIGNAGSELGVRGWVQALSILTGQTVWKAYSTGPDSDVLIDGSFKPFYAKDQGPNLGTTTWAGNQWQQGGSTTWGWLTYDPELNLLYYGTANPGVWNPDLRPGDNKWSSTIFARNPLTGKAVWAYQLTPHDGWDYDAVNEDTVVDLPINGKTTQVILHFNKNGYAYMLNRATGQLISANPFGTVTWATGIDLKSGVENVVPAMTTHTGVTTTGVCPSALGVKNWLPSAYSPKTQLFYLPTFNLCESIEPLEAFYIAGTPVEAVSVGFQPGPGGNMGALVAWNPVLGQQAWSDPEALPLYSGVLATAGNVVFYGTLDHMFKAVNATTGALLFQTQLECGMISNPMTYTGPDGHQRVAVLTGVGWLPGGFAGGSCPAENAYAPGNSALATAIKGAVVAKSAAPTTAPAPTSGYLHVFRLP